MMEQIDSLLIGLIPRNWSAGKSYLTVALGCTGGRHRSVAGAGGMAERVRGSRHTDLYVALKLVMDKLGNGGAPELGLPALGGFLFSRKPMSALADCELSNEHLLEAVRSLAFTQDGRTRRAVDYKNLGVRELGSVYESLLELHPTVNANAGTFSLDVVSGSERKTTWQARDAPA